MRTELCNEKTGKVKVTVWAEVIGDRLTIIGHDEGYDIIERWGREGRHFSYAFDAVNTTKIYDALSKGVDESSLMPLLTKFFVDMHGCKRLEEVCEKNDITYAFSSW